MRRGSGCARPVGQALVEVAVRSRGRAPAAMLYVMSGLRPPLRRVFLSHTMEPRRLLKGRSFLAPAEKPAAVCREAVAVADVYVLSEGLGTAEALAAWPRPTRWTSTVASTSQLARPLTNLG